MKRLATTNEEAEIRARTCQECGMLMEQEMEFHPYAFCVLKKAGLAPWDVIHMWERQPEAQR